MEEEKANIFKEFFRSPTAIMLILNIVVLITSMGIVWGTQSSRIDELRERIAAINLRLDIHEKTLYDDRNSLSNRLTGLETDTKYISQTLQELKLLVSPIPRRN